VLLRHPWASRVIETRVNRTPAALGARYPHIMTIVLEATGGRVPEGRGCNEQFEFEFALDILLDGFARLHEAGWVPPAHPSTRPPAPPPAHPGMIIPLLLGSVAE
jgi:hypothetical protein